MRSVKPFGLAVLFLLLAAFLVSTPALAAGGIKLAPTGVEPGASGQVGWGKARVVGVSEYGITYSAGVTVTCKGLTWGEAYYVYCLVSQVAGFPPGWVPVGDPFVASETGTGAARDTIQYSDASSKTIEVRNAKGVVVLTE